MQLHISKTVEYRIECVVWEYTCKATTMVAYGEGRYNRVEDAVKVFRSRGWKYSHKLKGWVCSECAKRLKRERKAANVRSE